MCVSRLPSPEKAEGKGKQTEGGNPRVTDTEEAEQRGSQGRLKRNSETWKEICEINQLENQVHFCQ